MFNLIFTTGIRTRAPTILEIDEMAPATLKRRRTETFDMALMVHGGTKFYMTHCQKVAKQVP